MTQHRSHLSSRLGALSIVACLAAMQADAQPSGSGLPSAEEIWRHLPGRATEPAPAPAPKPVAPASEAQPGPSAATARSRAPKAIADTRPRTLAQARVVIHYPEQGGFERAEELVRLLRILGAAEVETRSVRYPVDRQSIRYFHAADRDVSGIIADSIGGGGRATVSDFTFYRPTPRNGTIEIWLP